MFAVKVRQNAAENCEKPERRCQLLCLVCVTICKSRCFDLYFESFSKCGVSNRPLKFRPRKNGLIYYFLLSLFESHPMSFTQMGTLNDEQSPAQPDMTNVVNADEFFFLRITLTE